MIQGHQYDMPYVEVGFCLIQITSMGMKVMEEGQTE